MVYTYTLGSWPSRGLVEGVRKVFERIKRDLKSMAETEGLLERSD
jgi:hypothetical protein